MPQHPLSVTWESLPFMQTGAGSTPRVEETSRTLRSRQPLHEALQELRRRAQILSDDFDLDVRLEVMGADSAPFWMYGTAWASWSAFTRPLRLPPFDKEDQWRCR